MKVIHLLIVLCFLLTIPSQSQNHDSKILVLQMKHLSKNYLLLRRYNGYLKKAVKELSDNGKISSLGPTMISFLGNVPLEKLNEHVYKELEGVNKILINLKIPTYKCNISQFNPRGSLIEQRKNIEANIVELNKCSQDYHKDKLIISELTSLENLIILESKILSNLSREMAKLASKTWGTPFHYIFLAQFSKIEFKYKDIIRNARSTLKSKKRKLSQAQERYKILILSEGEKLRNILNIELKNLEKEIDDKYKKRDEYEKELELITNKVSHIAKLKTDIDKMQDRLKTLISNKKNFEEKINNQKKNIERDQKSLQSTKTKLRTKSDYRYCPNNYKWQKCNHIKEKDIYINEKNKQISFLLDKIAYSKSRIRIYKEQIKNDKVAIERINNKIPKVQKEIEVEEKYVDAFRDDLRRRIEKLWSKSENSISQLEYFRNQNFQNYQLLYQITETIKGDT